MADGLQSPSFERPPVVEVVASAAFRQLPEAASALFGAFWESRAAEFFPEISFKPPYEPQLERFGIESRRPSFDIHLSPDMPFPRIWMQTAARDEFLQLQRDWFACNWRKVGPSEQYSRWPSRREAFAKWYGRLSSFLDAHGLPALEVQQCEVTYVNHIATGGAWANHGELHKVMGLVQAQEPPQGLTQELTVSSHHFIGRTADGTPVGRLRVSTQPAFRAEDDPIWVLEFTSRVRVNTSDLGEVLAGLDEGRRWVVQSFQRFTTGEMRQEWGEMNGTD